MNSGAYELSYEEEETTEAGFSPAGFDATIREKVPGLVRLVFEGCGGNPSLIKKVAFTIKLTYYEEGDFQDS